VTTAYDVIVVGGGAVGAACARELAAAGRKVLICERGGDSGEGWRAAAGMLAPQIEAGSDDPLFDLGLAGRERYQDLAGPLKQDTGIDIGWWQCGIARVAIVEAETVSLKSKVAWQRQRGHVCDWFDSGEVKARWPWLGPTHGALWAPNEAALHPVRLVEALLADAQRLGATLIQDEVTTIERHGERITGVRGRDRHAANEVILAAGAWSKLVTGLPRPLSVEPIRGQMAAAPWPAGVPECVVVGAGSYILPRDGEAILGSTMEHAGYEVDVTPAGLASIFTSVSTLCPALAQADVTRTWAGLRPGTPDGLPIIGREPRARGLWYATGHGRNGILLASITGLMIARLIAAENEVEHLEAVRPERFWEF
jgi:glycine oxidase